MHYCSKCTIVFHKIGLKSCCLKFSSMPAATAVTQQIPWEHGRPGAPAVPELLLLLLLLLLLALFQHSLCSSSRPSRTRVMFSQRMCAKRSYTSSVAEPMCGNARTRGCLQDKHVETRQKQQQQIQHAPTCARLQQGSNCIQALC
jgi:hypothetical protein